MDRLAEERGDVLVVGEEGRRKGRKRGELPSAKKERWDIKMMAILYSS